MGMMIERRCEWAQAALTTFLAVCATPDVEDQIPDLICNLLHLARKRGENPEAILARAESNFEGEEADSE